MRKGAEATSEEVEKIRGLIRSNEYGSGSTRGSEFDIIGSGEDAKKRGLAAKNRRFERARNVDNTSVVVAENRKIYIAGMKRKRPKFTLGSI